MLAKIFVFVLTTTSIQGVVGSRAHFQDKCYGKSLKVNVSADMYSIVDVIESKQQIYVHQLISATWLDDDLRVNDSRDAGVHFVHSEQICFPEIVLLGSTHVTSIHPDNFNHEILVEELTGRVSILYPLLYIGTCEMDMYHYPFDVHVCGIQVAPFFRNASYLELTPISFTVNEGSLTHNNGWDILGTHMRKYMFKMPMGNHSVVDFLFVMRRQSEFYILHIILPTVVTTFIAILGFFSRSTSTGARQEKVRLGMMTLLSIAVQMLVIAERVPVTPVIPALSMFYTGILLLTAAAVCATVCILDVHTRGRVAPSVYRFVTGSLASTLCLAQKRASPASWKAAAGTFSLQRGLQLAYRETATGFKLRQSNNVAPAGDGGDKKSPQAEVKVNPFLTAEPDKQDILRDRRETQDMDFYSRVLDRLCFLVFTTLLICNVVYYLYHYQSEDAETLFMQLGMPKIPKSEAQIVMDYW